jgi:hypothetical protein
MSTWHVRLPDPRHSVARAGGLHPKSWNGYHLFGAFSGFTPIQSFHEGLFISLLGGKKMLLRTIDGLAPDTIKGYRSTLRRLWLSLPALGPDQARIAVQKIAQLERQLGIKASDVPGPGRPRRFS